MNGAVFSLSWQDLDDRVLAAQRRVFEHLQFPIHQHRIHGYEHGQWMDWVMREFQRVDLFIFVDADAFPMNKLALREAFARAAAGALYGNAQVSTHIDPSRQFVAPSWCAVSRQTWLRCDCPSARVDAYHDTGQRWTDAMGKGGAPIEMLLPERCVKPLWKLANGMGYGIGTTFASPAGARVFHMFGMSGGTYSDEELPAELRMKILEETAAGVCREG